jgi:FkbM family methyltransferase
VNAVPVAIADNRDVINRRDFIGGAVCGSAAAAGVAATLAWSEPPPLPPPPPPPQPPALPEHARLSFSQQGEDIVLYHVMHEMLKIATPTYVDVGAAYPVRGNNTYLLYTTGARGVLVEPNPALAAQLRAKRPADTVVEAGIGVGAVAEADYYHIKGNAMLNTFSAETVAHLQRGKTESVVERVVKMPLLDINGVIADHLGRAPDLLSTDVEGLDQAIIRTLDLARFRPGAICAEAVPTEKSGRSSALARYLGSRGYIPRGGSMYNTIFVDARRL